jgi:predicted dehydrogenase
MDDAMPAQIVRWGILGTGRAAHDFARGLQYVKGAELAAIGSRAADTAGRFARATGSRRAYGSYEALVADPAVDVVYIATPHTFHRNHCLLALNAGKAVLCEKPFAMNVREAQEIVDVATSKQLFCMEAMWMHFLPGMQKAIELVGAGAIGEPRMLHADFGVPTHFDADGRFFSAALGGGALMDRGVYPLALALRLFGAPEKIESFAAPASTGVDEQVSIMLKFSGGRMATLSATLSTYGANEAVIMGAEGRITIHEPLCRPDRLTLSRAPKMNADATLSKSSRFKDGLRSNKALQILRHLLPGRSKSLHLPYTGNGYNYEADEVMRCLHKGEMGSETWPLAQTISLARTLDIVRSRWYW